MTEMPAPPRGCPDPSILAAFVEGTLEPAWRGDVERHVADCPECPLVIAETTRFLRSDEEEAEEGADPSLRRSWWWLAAAAAFVTLCVAGVWQVVAKRDPLRRVKEIASESTIRPVEGRLAGFAYAPFSSPRSERRAPVDLALRAEVERLGEGAGTDAGALHARGVALLLTGDHDRALSLLEAATRDDPADASAWSDLSAAYVAAGTIGDRAHLLHAIKAARHAPFSAAAQFNRAVALEHLGRPGEAVSAYQRALELEPRSAWRQEIESRIARLQP